MKFLSIFIAVTFADDKVVLNPSLPGYNKTEARTECYMVANENTVTDGVLHFSNGTDLDCNTMTMIEPDYHRVDHGTKYLS